MYMYVYVYFSLILFSLTCSYSVVLIQSQFCYYCLCYLFYAGGNKNVITMSEIDHSELQRRVEEYIRWDPVKSTREEIAALYEKKDWETLEKIMKEEADKWLFALWDLLQKYNLSNIQFVMIFFLSYLIEFCFIFIIFSSFTQYTSSLYSYC